MNRAALPITQRLEGVTDNLEDLTENVDALRSDHSQLDGKVQLLFSQSETPVLSFTPAPTRHLCERKPTKQSVFYTSKQLYSF